MRDQLAVKTSLSLSAIHQLATLYANEVQQSKQLRDGPFAPSVPERALLGVIIYSKELCYQNKGVTMREFW
jgi:hypothetical protein